MSHELRTRRTLTIGPPDQVAHVFERFYQADESATRTQSGTRIGLSLVKELVMMPRADGHELVRASSGHYTRWDAPGEAV